ncbi:MAG: YcjX family protein [Firmicutes bacterium]|nr:YcjX family protein [Bacillota bacterium]
MARLPRIRRRNIRVGVIGLYGAGKTVFLTSLINHLRNHDPKRFQLGDSPCRVTVFRELAPEYNLPRFPYEQYRSSLVNERRWPRKTTVTSNYVLAYARSDHPLVKYRLSLLDLPGERIMDLSMYGSSYRTWSRGILRRLQLEEEYREPAEAYLRLAARPTTSEAVLIEAYRQLLRRLFCGYRPMITPSTYLLPAKTDDLTAIPQRGVFDQTFVGLGPDSQFAPLPERTLSQNRDLEKRFTQRYNAYVREIVRPMANFLRGCDSLVILVDVATVLAGGVSSYHGCRELLGEIIGALKPGDSGLPSYVLREGTRLTGDIVPGADSLLRLAIPHINRVAFVATQVDRVHERERQKLAGLLKDMTYDLIDARKEQSWGLQVDWFACAAVASTDSKQNGMIQARLQEDKLDNVIVNYTTTPVPEYWPEDWSPGDYQFPFVRPSIPLRRDAPPRHLDLDRVARFVLA